MNRGCMCDLEPGILSIIWLYLFGGSLTGKRARKAFGHSMYRDRLQELSCRQDLSQSAVAAR